MPCLGGCMAWLTGGSLDKNVQISDPEYVTTQNEKDMITAWEEYEKVMAHWNAIHEEDKKAGKKSKHPVLLRALWRTYKKDLILSAWLKLGWSAFILLCIAFFVRSILLYIKARAEDATPTNEERNPGFYLCSFFFVATLFLCFFLEQMTWYSSQLGIKVKAAVTTAVFRKTLSRAEGTDSKADVVAMVAKDALKLAEACITIQFLWSGVFEALVIFLVLFGFVKQAALPGFGVLLALLPIQYKLGLWIANKKKAIMVKASDRVHLMEEILRAIKLIKMYAWEECFSQKIHAMRKDEEKLITVQGYGKTVLISSVFVMPPLFVLSIFGVQETLFGSIEGSMAFTTLSLFNMLRLPLVKLPKALRDCTDSYAALERIENFLLEDDVDVKEPAPPGMGIKFDDATFAHGVSSKKPYFNNMTLHIPSSSLAMVAGPVGSGKSSLLKAMLGQLHIRGGHSQCGGTLAYVPQSPWCALGTVRENILFGKPYEERLYKQAVFACALETDFKLFPDGDLTWIGERGGNLSGGQKQRIALARAAYSQADIIILDSPLSAVDMYTCQHIFQNCIQDMMLGQGSAVVLATHQVELFPHADQLMVMFNGEFAYKGPYTPKAVKIHFPNSEAPAAIPRQKKQQMVVSGSNAPVGYTLNSRQVKKTDAGLVYVNGQQAVNKAAVVYSDPQKIQIDVQPPKVTKAVATENKENKGLYVLWYHMNYVYSIAWFGLPIFTVSQMTRTFSDVWISKWTGRTIPWASETFYLGTYAGYLAIFWLAMLIRGNYFYKIAEHSGRVIHRNAFNALLIAPMHFFNRTPLGQNLNFFSKDMDTIDDVMMDNIHMSLIYLFLLLITMYVLIRVVAVYAAVLGGLFIIFVFVFVLYIRSCKTVKERFSMQSAQLVAHTAETLTGLAVVRAFNQEKQFCECNISFQNIANKSGVALNKINLWLAFRVDMIGCVLVVTSCYLAAFTGGGSITASAAGLMVSNSFQILLFFSVLITTIGDINTQMSSVDRGNALIELESEKDLPVSQETDAPPNWPSAGVVSFRGVVMSYVPNTPPVLKGVDFDFKAGEKIGVVGRTGAGKSTLIMAMFRLADLTAGSIHVDGVSAYSLRLQQLRSKIAIIPQEPVMFKGTIRSNLDPFDEHTDSELVDALQKCLLGDLINEHDRNFGLLAPVEHVGSNFSLGQQQLMCLARAMLNKSKLLLLDEATAALDSDTDAAVQKIIREFFGDRTIMTIAHRLDTIIDSDRILAMDAGKVAEFDTPKNLIYNPKSIFHELCKNAGETQFQVLKKAVDEKAKVSSAGKEYEGHHHQIYLPHRQHLMPHFHHTNGTVLSPAHSLQHPMHNFLGSLSSMQLGSLSSMQLQGPVSMGPIKPQMPMQPMMPFMQMQPMMQSPPAQAPPHMPAQGAPTPLNAAFSASAFFMQ